MWAIDNHTPFAAERGFARDRDGAEVWLVAVKGTFKLQPDGTLTIADTQEPVNLAPVFSGEPGKSSLRYESDLALAKPATDILLHGRAYAPNEQPVTELLVTLRVGALEKTLRVIGDQTWEDADDPSKLSAPVPFTAMPLVYERAFGGSDAAAQTCEPRNPVGRGFASERVGKLAPNIAYPDAERAQEPAGFGPIARDWAPRLARAGTYDAAWRQARMPRVPEDFDDRFWQAAPDDQQAARRLVGGELVKLTNLTREGELQFRVPRVPMVWATRIGRRHQLHAPGLHMLTLEPDRARVMLSWQIAVPCHADVYELKRTTIAFKRRIPRASDVR